MYQLRIRLIKDLKTTIRISVLWKIFQKWPFVSLILLGCSLYKAFENQGGWLICKIFWMNGVTFDPHDFKNVCRLRNGTTNNSWSLYYDDYDWASTAFPRDFLARIGRYTNKPNICVPNTLMQPPIRARKIKVYALS